MKGRFELSIRKAGKGDIKEISNIFREESSKKPYLQEHTEKTSLIKIKDLFRNGHVYVIEVDKKVVGFSASNIRYGKNAFIDEIWIKSAYHKKGIGKTLLGFVEDVYRKKGLKSIKLISDKKSGAFYFYKKLGYKEKSQYVLMVKKLGKRI